MKFSCQQCSTAYNVPDDKVRGKRVRIKCKKCGAPIVIEGPPAAAARPVRSLQQTQVGGLVAPPDLAKKIEEAKRAAKPPVPGPAPSPWTVAIDRSKPTKMTLDELVAAFERGEVTDKTLVWRKGQPEWMKPFDVAEVADALRAAGHDAGAGAAPAPARPAVPLPPPAPVPPPAPIPIPVPAPPAAPAAPLADSFSDDFDDDEATAVIDADRAQALLRAQAAAGSSVATPADADFDDEDEATRVADLSVLSAPGASDGPGPAFDDEDDITQVATTAVARELLEKAAPGLTLPTDEERAPAAKPAPSAEPAVVVSEEDRASDTADDADEDASEEGSFDLKDEPTRIVRPTPAKKGRTSLIIALVVVILASAAGGFLASRFVPQRSVPGSGQ